MFFARQRLVLARPCNALNPAEFIDAVVAAINQAGLCSTPSPGNPGIEVVAKLNNHCEESWAVRTSAQVVRHSPHHRSTCKALPSTPRSV